MFAGIAALLVGVTRGRTVPGVRGRAGLAWPLSALRGLPWLGRSLRGIARRRQRRRASCVTVVWSLLGVLVFGLLFVSADAVVADWADAVLPDLTARRVRAALLHRACSSAGRRSRRRTSPSTRRTCRPFPAGTARPTAHRFEWLVPVLLVDAVFAVFVAAQAAVLFGGHDYVERTTGLTYADYVHQGFGQLTVATLLMLHRGVGRRPARSAPSPRTGSGCASPSACCAR